MNSFDFCGKSEPRKFLRALWCFSLYPIFSWSSHNEICSLSRVELSISSLFSEIMLLAIFAKGFPAMMFARPKANRIIKQRSDTLKNYSSMSTFQLALRIFPPEWTLKGRQARFSCFVMKILPESSYFFYSLHSLPVPHLNRIDNFSSQSECLRFEFQVLFTLNCSLLRHNDTFWIHF